MSGKIGIVVPTLGNRPDYLKKCLESIREAGDCFILLVGPTDKFTSNEFEFSLVDKICADPGIGLAAAINFGIKSLPSNCEYVSWLGDDDVLTPNSLSLTSQVLGNNDKLVAVYGICEYIDAKGDIFWANGFGQLAVPLLAFGPNKIPQPGSLIRRSALNRIGGLDDSLGWAFDQDMFARLNKIGKIKFVRFTVAKFRWHENSLTVGSSQESLMESSWVRKKNASTIALLLLKISEPIHIFLARHFPSQMNKKEDE